MFFSAPSQCSSRVVASRLSINPFIENQKRDLRVYLDGQLAQSQERAEKLTLRVLEIAATKVVPILIALF